MRDRSDLAGQISISPVRSHGITISISPVRSPAVRSRRSDLDLAGQISLNRRSERGGDELSGATGMEVDSAREKRRGEQRLAA